MLGRRFQQTTTLNSITSDYDCANATTPFFDCQNGGYNTVPCANGQSEVGVVCYEEEMSEFYLTMDFMWLRGDLNMNTDR